MSMFNGPADEVGRESRLTVQHEEIKALMGDTLWRTLGEISAETGFPEASVSAQLRHLRKTRFGSYVVEKRHVKHGLYQYRVLPPGSPTNVA